MHAVVAGGEVAQQVGQLRGEVVRGVLVTSQRAPDTVGEPDGPPQAHVDPPRVQRLQHPELLGDHERLVVGQHHATGADPDRGRRRRYRRGQHGRRRSRDTRHAVVFRHPETVVAQLLGLLREPDRVPQRLGVAPARAIARTVENGQSGRCHTRVNARGGRGFPGVAHTTGIRLLGVAVNLRRVPPVLPRGQRTTSEGRT
nr:putative membrane protein [Kibdelosporangium sp. MJ126-NF4]CTQ91004.1 putative membrane protein [Kibdelosporangium sp. MJ126-NF4]